MSKVYNFGEEKKGGVDIQIYGDFKFTIYPNDLEFIENATNMYKEVKKYQEESQDNYKDMDIKVDEEGVPENVSDLSNAIKEEFSVICNTIDGVLGEGVCDHVFEGRVNIALLGEFMSFVGEAIEQNRETSMDKYLKPRNRAERRAVGKVM